MARLSKGRSEGQENCVLHEVGTLQKPVRLNALLTKDEYKALSPYARECYLNDYAQLACTLPPDKTVPIKAWLGHELMRHILKHKSDAGENWRDKAALDSNQPA